MSLFPPPPPSPLFPPPLLLLCFLLPLLLLCFLLPLVSSPPSSGRSPPLLTLIGKVELQELLLSSLLREESSPYDTDVAMERQRARSRQLPQAAWQTAPLADGPSEPSGPELGEPEPS